jgi:hypothetical protein
MSCGRVNDGNYVQINDSHTLLLLVGLFLSLKELRSLLKRTYQSYYETRPSKLC